MNEEDGIKICEHEWPKIEDGTTAIIETPCIKCGWHITITINKNPQ